MTTEANIWQWIKKANEPGEIFLWRVENAVGSGEPDIAGYVRGLGQIYIELKAAKMPVRNTSKPSTKVRPSQIIWHDRMTELGSKTHFILLQVDKDRYLMPGSIAGLFHTMRMVDFEPFLLPAKITPRMLIDSLILS